MTDTLLGYEALLCDLKNRIRSARSRSALAVNRELVLFYWQIGREILARQEAEKCGYFGDTIQIYLKRYYVP